MTRFWFVRHGPTHAKAFAGWRDIPADLSDADAIARLNAHLPALAPVISSDLCRATATADTLCDARPRLPHDPGLREFNFGDWDGLPFDEVARRWPDLSRRYWEEPGHTAPPRGESWLAAAERVERALSRLPPVPDVIVVAHFGVILTQYQRAALLTPVQALAQDIANLSVTCLTFLPPGVLSINHCP
ncbi:MAG: histidine phosphatase family protein [Rhodobacterales bacterium]|nr:histidine phosphatase family protein [Rhodobacterales bacterium]